MSRHCHAPFRHSAAALLVAGLLAACGGGNGADAPTKTSTAPPVRALADAATVNALFDWAEQAYPVYFPSRRTNQFAAPYTYRYYPETGVYLGVDADRVYVLGGPFGGQPLFVGLVNNLLPAGPARPAGTGNGCWDLDFMETPGRHTVVESRSSTASGVVTSGLSQEWRVLGARSFEGQSRLATDTTVTLSLPSGQVTSVQRNTSYTSRAQNGGVTIFGDEGSLTTGAVASSFRTVFSPGWTDNQYVMVPGQTDVQNWTGTSTAQGRTSPLQGGRTIRFVARETITVPAGTFETCRFEQSQSSSPTPLTTWIAVGWGVPVQLRSGTGAQATTTAALRIAVDGQPVRGNTGTAPP